MRRTRGSWRTTCIRWTRWARRAPSPEKPSSARFSCSSTTIPPLLPATWLNTMGSAGSFPRWVIRRGTMSIRIGIIGGSGLYDMAELADREEKIGTTPFGEPSGPYVIGTLRGKRVAFLARHGAGHRILPSELNFRANIYGFKVLGVERLLSASAVGSLKEEYRPLDLLVPDQFFDRTAGRISTFFGRGLVAHVAFAHPLCGELSKISADSAGRAGATARRAGTYVHIAG